MWLETLPLLHTPLRDKTGFKIKNPRPLLLHALSFPAAELGQKRRDPSSSLVLPAASPFVKEEEPQVPLPTPSSSAAADMSL